MPETGTLQSDVITTVTLDGRYYEVQVMTDGAEIWVTTDGRNPDYQRDVAHRVPFGRTVTLPVAGGATPTVIKLRSREAPTYTITPMATSDTVVNDAEVAAAVAAHAVSETAHSGTYGWPVAAPGGVDDTAVVQAAIDAANAAGGGSLFLQPGIYVCTTLTLYSNVWLVGAGIDTTTIKLKNSTNGDLIKTQNFATLTGTTTNSGTPEKFGLRDLTLDGNKANNTSGWPLRIFGSSYKVHDVEIKNGKSGGCWTEWGSSGNDMEAHWSNFKIRECDGTGLDMNGPHDSVFVNGQVFKNTGIGVHVGTSGGGGYGAMFIGVHSWGTEQTWAWDLEGASSLEDCVGEGAATGQVYVRSNRISILGGEYFGVVGDPNSVGIEIGDGVATPDRLHIDTRILDCQEAGLRLTSGGGKSVIRALIVCAAAGTAIDGTFPTTTQVEIATNYNSVSGGLTAMPVGAPFFTNDELFIRSNELNALLAQQTDLTNVFNVNTANKRVEVLNGSKFRSYSGDFSGQTAELDAATGNLTLAGILNAADPDSLTVGEEVFPRINATSNGTAMNSQQMRLAYFTARKTETITSVRVISGVVAAGATPTLIRIGIWTADLDGALLSLVASTPNDTALLASTVTAYTKALSASFVKTAGQRYAVGLLVVTAATVPQILATSGNINASESALSPKLSAHVSGQADLPATLAAGSASANGSRPYFALVP